VSTEISEEILLRQLEAYLQVYAHHWDALLRAYFLYFASVGVVSGFLLKESSGTAREPLLWIIIVGSVLATCGGLLAFWWFLGYYRIMEALANKLSIEPLPFRRERLAVVALVLASTVVSVGALWVWKELPVNC